jgi:acyl-CoA dehydrogenase
VISPHVEPALADLMDSVFAEHGGAPDLWRRLDELGLVRLTGSEDTGGSGAGWFEAAELMSAAVRHGARIPLAEHDLLACWLLDAAGMPHDGQRSTLGLLDEDRHARAVPWASTADRIVLVAQRGDIHMVADIEPAEVSIIKAVNQIGEPRDTVIVEATAVAGVEISERLAMILRLKAALIRAIQICAALDRTLELTIEHCTSRTQFGRPLAKFQAVQHLVADIAGEAALARSATEAALTAAVASDWSAPDLMFLVAAARSCAGHAVTVVARNAHQVHGAIGTTDEHALHHFTRAALAWRTEFGTTRQWDELLTDAALHAAPTGLWPLLSP